MMKMFNKNNAFFSIITILVLLLSSSTISAQNIQTTYTGTERLILQFISPDIIIPDDYLTIQEGIDNSAPGNVIFVRAGIYQENINVDKKDIQLIGESKLNTTIDGGSKSKDTVKINAENVTIRGFSIINGNTKSTGAWDIAGIKVYFSNAKIKDNLIMWNRIGINAVDIAYDLEILNNSFVDNGLLVANYEYNDVHTIKSYMHTIENNTLNDKPLYYFKNQKDIVVPDDAGQVLLANCTNVTIKDTHFAKSGFPIILGFCSKCIVENNTVNDAWGEIILLQSNNCTIQNNTASGLIYGVCLDYKSKDNIVRYNKVRNSMAGIVLMTSSSNNSVYENCISGNSIGVCLQGKAHDNNVTGNVLFKNTVGFKIRDNSNNNRITKNKIMKSFYQAVSLGRTKNDWNNNYWNRPRLMPKVIYSYVLVGSIFIPYFIADIDPRPARKL